MLWINRVSVAAFAFLVSTPPLLAQTAAQTPVQPPTTASAPAAAAAPQTQTPPQTGASGGSTSAPVVDSPHGTAIALLDRVQKVLDKAVDGKGDQVTLERGMVDEMRAELTQIKLTLQAEKR